MRTIHLSKYRYAAVLIFVALSFAFIGRAYAWETTLNYAAGLAGAGGSAWAPGAGNLNGDVWLDPNDNFRRKTQPYGSQSWNANEMNWIKANSGRLSITFHSSYHGNTGRIPATMAGRQSIGLVRTSQEESTQPIPATVFTTISTRCASAATSQGCQPEPGTGRSRRSPMIRSMMASSTSIPTGIQMKTTTRSTVYWR